MIGHTGARPGLSLGQLLAALGRRERGRPADPFEAAAASAARLAEVTGAERHDVALVLGSGWTPAADQLGEVVADVPVTELGGFAPSTVPGHGAPSARSAAATAGCSPSSAGSTSTRATARRPSCTACAPRCWPAARTVVLTNAAGGLKEGFQVGQAVLIADHINLTGSVAARPGRTATTSAPASSTSPTPSPPACATSPGASTPTSTRACTPASPARSTRRRRRCAWPARSAPTWSACRPCTSAWPPCHLGRRGARLLARHQPGRRADAARSSTTPRCVAAGTAAAERMGGLLAAVVADVCERRPPTSQAAARAWLADDPDPDTRAELEARARRRTTRRAWPSGSAPASSSARPGCGARSAPGRTA